MPELSPSDVLALSSTVVDDHKSDGVRAPDITRDMIVAFLTQRGWVNERPGKLYAWRDPHSNLSGFTLFAAFQEAVLSDEDQVRRANAGGSQSVDRALKSVGSGGNS